MNVLSLFDGISTGRLALEMAGVKVDRYMASEIERAPMEISAANWPDIVQLGDVKHIKAADLPKIDLVISPPRITAIWPAAPVSSCAWVKTAN